MVGIAYAGFVLCSLTVGGFFTQLERPVDPWTVVSIYLSTFGAGVGVTQISVAPEYAILHHVAYMVAGSLIAFAFQTQTDSPNPA